MEFSQITAPARPSPVYMLPPPLYFGLSFGLAMLLQRLVPLALPDFGARPMLGWLLIAAGIAFGPILAAFFMLRRTTLNPFGSPRRLFEGGVYRLSRNPMYLGVIMIYLGGCLLAGSYWPLLLLIVPLGLLAQIVIPYEEASMRLTFGPAYEDYCHRVRRWL